MRSHFPISPICHAAFCILHFPLLVLLFFLLLLSIYEWSDFRCTSRARTCRVVLPPRPPPPTSLPTYSTLTGSGKCSERQCIQWSALSARNTWTEPQEEKTRSNNNKSEWGRSKRNKETYRVFCLPLFRHICIENPFRKRKPLSSFYWLQFINIAKNNVEFYSAHSWKMWLGW